MYSSRHIDWLAVTYPASVIPNGTLPRAARQGPWKLEGRGGHGYRKRLSNPLGAQVLADGDERQGIHLVLGGAALLNIRHAGVSDRDLCHFVMDNGGKPSRLDLALNLHEGRLMVEDFVQAYHAKALKTLAKSGKRFHGVDEPGDTFYLGAPSSDRRMRIYDKAAEEGLPGTAWLRMELQLRNERASGVANVLATQDNTGGVINRMIGGYCTMPENTELNQALEDQAGEVPQESRKLHSTLKWLADQVAPAVARYQSEHPDEDVLGFLDGAIRAELKRRGEVEPDQD